MASQTALLPRSFNLDARSREAGRRGLTKARAALAEASARNAAERLATDTAAVPTGSLTAPEPGAGRPLAA